MDEFCVPKPGVMSYTGRGPACRSPPAVVDGDEHARERLAIGAAETEHGADGLRESCCTPSIERPDAGPTGLRAPGAGEQREGRSRPREIEDRGDRRRDTVWTRRRCARGASRGSTVSGFPSRGLL